MAVADATWDGRASTAAPSCSAGAATHLSPPITLILCMALHLLLLYQTHAHTHTHITHTHGHAPPPCQCRYWDETLAAWSSEGLVAVAPPSSTPDGFLHCESTHLTTFGGILKIPTSLEELLEDFTSITFNAITLDEFATVLTQFDVMGNPQIFTVGARAPTTLQRCATMLSSLSCLLVRNLTCFIRLTRLPSNLPCMLVRDACSLQSLSAVRSTSC